MSKITLQKIFDLAWRKFIIQDALPATERCFPGTKDAIYQCAYLTEDDRKCGVGLALPNGHEAQNYQGPAGELINHFPDLFDIKPEHLELGITKFQFAIHDDLVNRTTGEWAVNRQAREFAYRGVAAVYGLTVPEYKGHDQD